MAVNAIKYLLPELCETIHHSCFNRFACTAYCLLALIFFASLLHMYRMCTDGSLKKYCKMI